MKNERITNAEVRRRFTNSEGLTFFWMRRVAKYIGKVVQDKDSDNLQKKLMAAWIPCPRKLGRPQQNSRKTFLQTIRRILPGVGPRGELTLWYGSAKDSKLWSELCSGLKTQNNDDTTVVSLTVEDTEDMEEEEEIVVEQTDA